MSYFLKTQKNTSFSDAIIPDPIPNSQLFSLVYFGNHNDKPLKWRVFAKRTTAFSYNKTSKELFLDCDSVVSYMQFMSHAGFFRDYCWLCSDLRNYLRTTFTEACFTSTEIAALHYSYTPVKKDQAEKGPQYDRLENDTFFVLDISEIPGNLAASKFLKRDEKTDQFAGYWLRTYPSGDKGDEICAVLDAVPAAGIYYTNLVYTHKNNEHGVSPACNIRQESIMFTSKVDTNTFKLTIVDDKRGQIFREPAKKVEIRRRLVTVPYMIQNVYDNLNSVSIMILDKEYKIGENNDDASLIYYEILVNPRTYSQRGVVSFNLPEDLSVRDWDQKYHVYLMAEEIGEKYETDYVSHPYEIKADEIEGNTCTVTFYRNRTDSKPYKTQEVVIGRCTTKPINPSSNDYYFKGWYLAGGTEFDFSTTISRNITLYARWEAKPIVEIPEEPEIPQEPEVTEYDIWVGETQITSQNAGDVLGNGKVVYDSEKNTLTFNNATVKKYTAVNFSASYMLVTGLDLTILGKVKLESENASGGIYVRKGATLELNADITISAQRTGIFSFNAKEIKVSGGNLKINNVLYGINLGGDVPISTILSLNDGIVEILSKNAGVVIFKNGKFKLDDKLIISEPRHGDTGAAVIEGYDITTIVDESGQVANDILIEEGPAEDAVIADFVLENGLEYNNRRYEHIYTAKDIEPTVIVTSGRKNPKVLKEGVNYTVSYSNNKNATNEDSPAVATITYKGNFKGTTKLLFHILPKPIGNSTDSTPAEEIFLGDVVLVDGGDFNVNIFYNGHKIESKYYILKADKEKQTVTITGKNNYSESIKDVDYTLLTNAEADNTKIKAHLAFTYDGEPKVFTKDQLSVRDGNNNALTSSKYFVQYEDNIDAGLAKAHVTANNRSGYYGESVIYYDILPDKDKSVVKAEVMGKVYYVPGGAQPPVKVTAILDKKTLILQEGKDYTVSYQYYTSDSFRARYKILFKGNYEGRAPYIGDFTILPAPFTEKNVTVCAPDLVYTEPGDYKAVIYVSVDGKLLRPENYTVQYLVGDEDITTSRNFTLTGNQMPVTVIVKGRNLYEETEVRVDNCYYIRKLSSGTVIDISAADIVLKGTKKAIPSQMYTGKPIEPPISLLFKDRRNKVPGEKLGLKEGRDFQVYYFDNIQLGTAFVFVKAKSNNGKTIGNVTDSFKIIRRDS
jgi:uncharacterized repeat protein (TIGR02543 family)